MLLALIRFARHWVGLAYFVSHGADLVRSGGEDGVDDVGGRCDGAGRRRRQRAAAAASSVAGRVGTLGFIDLCRRNNREEWAQAPGIPEDRDNHRRPRLSGAAPYSRCGAFWYIPAIGVVTFCWFRSTCVCEFGRHEPDCAVVCSVS
jgi:hypothetical protein